MKRNVKPTYFAQEFLDSRPFTSYREMLPLLRSCKANDRAIFASRLAHTPIERAVHLLQKVLFPPAMALILYGYGLLVLLARGGAAAGNLFGLLSLAYVADLVGNVLILSAWVSMSVVWFEHRGTRDAVRYIARLNDYRAVPLLIKFLYKQPINGRQRLWNEQCYGDIARLLDELDDSALQNIPVEPLRQFFERQYFRHLRRARQPISESHLFMLVAILHFLRFHSTFGTRLLFKRICNAPPPKDDCPNRAAFLMLREVADSLLHRRKDEPLLTPFANPAPFVPATTGPQTLTNKTT